MEHQKVIDLLRDLSDYMENKADCDDGQPNEEMKFQVKIEELLPSLTNPINN